MPAKTSPVPNLKKSNRSLSIDDYETLTDAAVRNKVTGGRLRQLCIAGAVLNARKFGSVWLIPKAFILSGKPGRPAKTPACTLVKSIASPRRPRLQLGEKLHLVNAPKGVEACQTVVGIANPARSKF
jgi:hypothetical protein